MPVGWGLLGCLHSHDHTLAYSINVLCILWFWHASFVPPGLYGPISSLSTLEYLPRCFPPFRCCFGSPACCGLASSPWLAAGLVLSFGGLFLNCTCCAYFPFGFGTSEGRVYDSVYLVCKPLHMFYVFDFTPLHFVHNRAHILYSAVILRKELLL